MKVPDPPPLAIWPADRTIGVLLGRIGSHLAAAGRLAAEAAREGIAAQTGVDLEACAQAARSAAVELGSTVAGSLVQSRPRGTVLAAATAGVAAVDATMSAAHRLGAVAKLRDDRLISLGGVLRDACRSLDAPAPVLEVRRLRREARDFRQPPDAALSDPLSALRWRDATLAAQRALRACEDAAIQVTLLRDA